MTVAGVEARPTMLWTSSSEPHALRRKAMMQKYSAQIKPLMGNNPWTALPVTVVCVLQTAAALAVGIYDLSWWTTLLLGYLFGSVLAGNLMAAHHEITHWMVFKRPFWNKVLMAGANAPLGIPLGSLFRQYHQDHHSHMGVEGVDTGIWQDWEARWVNSFSDCGPVAQAVSKFLMLSTFWVPFFFRPFFMGVTKKLDITDLSSWIVVPAYDVAIFYFSGYSLKPFAYLLAGLCTGVSLHPIAGHVITEHCMMANDGQETHSCYDPICNPLLYNFGYHVEHHDFPNIPWNRLGQLRTIAPEYYDHLTSYPTWCHAIYKFIFDPSVGHRGVMTKRAERTGTPESTPAAVEGVGGGKASVAAAAVRRLLVPHSAMPLLRGIPQVAVVN